MQRLCWTAGGGAVTREQWREALKEADKHVAFALLDTQEPAVLVEALGGPRTRFATWRDVKGLLAVAWLQLDHDRRGATMQPADLGVVMSAGR
jgi:hypothetical protein